MDGADVAGAAVAGAAVTGAGVGDAAELVHAASTTARAAGARIVVRFMD
jgi:hypothetical protein